MLQRDILKPTANKYEAASEFFEADMMQNI